MKLKIKKDILIDALQLITPITDKSTSKPILSNFLLKADAEGEGQAEFSATDYEISIRGLFPADISEPGSVCISAKMALEVCREFLTTEVEIESDDQLWVTLTGGEARLRLPSVEVGLYPVMEKTELVNKFNIQAKELKKCIDLTIFATQTAETRKNLMGVCLKFDEGNIIHWTATDGHRLARVEKKLEGAGLNSPAEIIIPRKALVELQKVLEKADEEVELAFDERSLQVTTRQIVLTSRLIEGKFPNVEQVIPRDSDKLIVVNRERMVNALRIISIMSSDKIRPVKLSLTPDLMKLESERAEYGESRDELPVEYQGEELQIGFNARYLLDVLAILSPAEKITMEMKGPLNPCLITIQDDSSFLTVVMPLRIEW